MSELQARVDRSTAWVAVASFLLGIFDLVSTLICLRLWVSTAELGDATLAIALFPVLDRLGGSGLGSWIVQELGGETEAMSTVFWVGAGAASTVLLALVAVHPLLGAWFPRPIVATLLVAYAGKLVLQHAGTVPEAMLKRELRYYELSVVRVIGGAVEMTSKLVLAYAGAHYVPALRIWCFALGPIAGALVVTAGVQVCHPWRPRFVFRRDLAARAVRFTAAISGGDLLYFAYTSTDYLVVGAFFGDAAVGVYRLAYELVLDVVRLVSMVTAEVAFPTFAKLAAEGQALGAQLVRFTRQNLVVLAPFLVFVVIEADDLLALLYPPLPHAAALATRILCAVGALRTLSFVLPPLLAGSGAPGRVLVYNAIASVVLPATFVAAAALAPGAGFVAVAWGWAIGYPVAFAALVAMTLPRAQLAPAAYMRAIAGVLACAAGALLAGTGVRTALAAGALRAAAVAATVLVVYVPLLARIEGITLAGIVRGFRGEQVRAG